MALRPGFQRYALSLQYHGASFLGFQWQHGQEDCIIESTTTRTKNNRKKIVDMRGWRTVEGRIREALDECFPDNDSYDNVQGSSRTDRGVHALKNTMHVDIRQNCQEHPLSSSDLLRRLQRALASQETVNIHDGYHSVENDDNFAFINQQIRLLNAKEAPRYMENPFAVEDTSQTPLVDWNARFSATQRTYVYRILQTASLSCQRAWPFEYDRAWRVPNPLDVNKMQRAADILQGTHDFSSFRNAHCQRHSPIVTLNQIRVATTVSSPTSRCWEPWLANSENSINLSRQAPQVVTIAVQGNAFVYRQVRNIVGCLTAVGRGQLEVDDVRDILEAKDRRCAPVSAPAQGLFLVDVQHGKFFI